MKHRSRLIGGILGALMLLSVVSYVSYAWLTGVNIIRPTIHSSVITQYFEQGTGSANDPFVIHTPRHLYNLAWLQYLGYFNHETDAGSGVVDQYYFKLCDGVTGGKDTCKLPDFDNVDKGADPAPTLDMSGWTLPPIGTAKYPFLGNFDGNGVIIKNLTVSGDFASLSDQAVTGSFFNNDASYAAEKLSGTGYGCDVVGLFGVVGAIGVTDADPTWNDGTNDLTYTRATNAIHDVTLTGLTVETPEQGAALAGLAAGYLNGTLENVRLVGGTISNQTNAAITNLSANLSDYAAVGHCEDRYISASTDTAVKLYDPQVISTGGSGSVNQQGNNWGASVGMRDMYNDLVDVYTDPDTVTTITSASELTITHHVDGTTKEEVVQGSTTHSTSLSVTAGNTNYPIKVAEAKDGDDTIASYSLIQRDRLDQNGQPTGQPADFIYLYGEHQVGSVTQTIHHIYEHEDAAIRIYSGSNYLTFNGSAFGNTTTEANATKWVIDDDGHIYTVVNSGTAQAPVYNRYYMIKNGSNALAASAALDADAAAPNGTTVWTVDSANHEISCGEYYLTYKDGIWQLVRKVTNFITESTNTNYMTVAGPPAAIGNTTTKASALPWVQTDVGANHDDGFTLQVEYNGATYYLQCASDGTLSIAASPDSPTVWYEMGAAEGVKAKIYMLTDENNGFALYYDSASGWQTTPYTTVGFGPDWGGSIDMKSMDERLFTLLNTNLAAYNVNSSAGTLATVQTGHGVRTTSGYHWYYSDSDNSVSTFDSTASLYYKKDPNSNNVVYRLQGGIRVRASSKESTNTGRPLFPLPHSILPLLVDKANNYSTLSGNTGYIVGGSTSTTTDGYGLRTTVRAGSYGLEFIGHSISSSGTGSASYVQSQLEVITNTSATYSASNFGRIYDKYNSSNTNVSSTLTSQFSTRTVDADKLKKYNSSRAQLHTVMNGSSFVHGLHFTGSTVSKSDTVTLATAYIYDNVYTNYQLPCHSLDFNLKEKGYINFFAGSYGKGGVVGNNSDSFFALFEVIRDGNQKLNGTGVTGTNIKEISKIYKDKNLPADAASPYVYTYVGGTDSYSSNSSRYELVFDCQFLWNAPPVANALYYFEVPVNAGEYALGSHSGKKDGTYLIYLDISANANVEGDSKFDTATVAVVADSKSAGTLDYVAKHDDTGTNPVSSYPTYYPLAWGNDARTAVASSNTGYLIAGANTDSNPPGDIRVSQYTKYANGNWASIRNSLTSANNAGVLNNARVYTIVGGTQQSITNYGIGNQYTMQYARVSEEMNDLLRNQQYVYGLHFMQASISASSTVTVPKAVINGTTYTNYEMPQDSIDFNVAATGRITFMAGTYFSGSQNLGGTRSFFSLHQIFRYQAGDPEVAAGTKRAGDIRTIREIDGIYGDGTNEYYYKYDGDAKYYSITHPEGVNALPSDYAQVFDTSVIAENRDNLTQNSVYYFEIPVDPGEYALGSAGGNGAYLIYLDIAANADFDVKTVITETVKTDALLLNYPQGVAFIDAADSTVYDVTSGDDAGKVDPAKSVFLSLPAGASSGDTALAITDEKEMTVSNTGATLAGCVSQNVPRDATLLVNGSAPASAATSSSVVIELVTETESNASGAMTTKRTTTTQTTEGSTVTTNVVQTVTTQIGASTNTVTTSPAPNYDGHSLIPTDYTGATPQTADTILECFLSGNGLTASVERSGGLNYVETGRTLTVNGVTFNVFDVVKQTAADGTVPAGTYTVTVSGSPATYLADVTKLNTDFSYTLNGDALTATGERFVTVP